MKTDIRTRRRALFASAAAPAIALALIATSVQAQEPAKSFSIAPQPLADALLQLSRQADIDIVASTDLTRGRTAPRIDGQMTTADAMSALLAGSGLVAAPSGAGYVITRASDPQSGSAAGDGADGTVQALIVTAQKREEDIQDVPIAISAFTQEDLTRSQVAGGPDLITQVPNMTFTKTNFSSYSIQIRGIGTQAISATTDPAVAVAFNNTPFVRNRFFEQEFYDLERVEVLRGPQGTLYGRNATAGVVNIISAKPKFIAEAKASADIGNFSSSRIEGMVNIPLVEDKVALRLAGAWTKRDGYATNELTGNPIDGRDLWSTRLSLRFAPTDAINVNLIWEHFQEDDDRLRSGKQLCHKDVVTEVAGIPTPDFNQTLPETGLSRLLSGVQASFSQGCKRGSLYSPDAFQTPVGLMLPYYAPLGAIGLPISVEGDPYISNFQSQDLRSIQSTVDPDYRAKADLGELQVSIDLADGLTLQSETSYSADWVFSLQDFNRFNTRPGAWRQPDGGREGVLQSGPNGGIFCDPQLGCSDRMVAVDLSTAKSHQFSQEFRVGSDFDGPFNFSVGANFLRYDTEDKYYVFINSLSLIAARGPVPAPGADPYPAYQVGITDNRHCLADGSGPGDPNDTYSVSYCVYMDPNPIGSLNDQGHNYFLSKNPYKLISYAVFGESYYNLTDNLKITAGLRWTVDKKEAPRIPSWVLASSTYGYPVAEVIEQEWREPTGRLAIDWKPDLSFTDDTLLYGSYAHGYKAGGANPPGFVRVFYAGDRATAEAQTSATKPKTFNAEFVDAFELGAKNTLDDGKVTLNLAAFYYDYKDYQISEIVDRSAFNRNFDADVWGLEIEADWRPLENLRLGFKGGYEKTRIADGEQAIDLMDRTAGDPNWTLHRPFPTIASSCILPTFLFVSTAGANSGNLVNLGGPGGGNPGGCELAYGTGVDPVTKLPYVPNPTVGLPFNTIDWYDNYPGFDPKTAPNGGEGIMKPLGGNELPNAPNWTGTITADYTLPLPNDWRATFHTDLHWQSESWWRVFNDNEFSRLDEYFTMNLAAIFTNEERGWNVMAYVKNVTDVTAITGAFLNSDDTGLTTNVFLTEPRLYGIRATKSWTGGSLLGNFGERHEGPYPFTLELGGQVQRDDAPAEALRPGFADALPVGLDTFSEIENRDLDWGDGRDVKLTWRPDRSPWMVAAGVRFGSANSFSRNHAALETDKVCPVAYDPCPYNLYSQTNWSDVESRRREEHTLVDFSVGRDFGLGEQVKSSLSAGLRYAEFKSSRTSDIDAIPDWYFVDGWYLSYSHFHRYGADLNAERTFEGMGPTVAWDASMQLLGDDDAGRLNIDGSLTGGILFGKQKASIKGSESSSYYEISGRDLYQVRWNAPSQPTVVTPVALSRSDSVSVPAFGASLGLSYNVDRFSIGAGYRWERYFNVLDVGYDKADDGDRTIDGPYLKIAVGFGG